MDWCPKHRKAKPGPTNARWKHGHSSAVWKQLDGVLKTAFESAIADPKLTSTAANAALWDARMVELLALLREQGSVGLWAQLAGAWADHKETVRSLFAASRGNNPEMLQKALRALEGEIRDGPIDAVIAKGKAVDSIWQELKDADDHSVRAKAAEQKRRADRKASVTREEFATVMAAIRMAMWNTIKDRALLVQLDTEYQRLLAPIIEGRKSR